MELDSLVEKLPKVGSFLSSRLRKLNISTIDDLINHYPFRYENPGESKNIAEIYPGDSTSSNGQIWQIKNVRTRFGKFLTLATVNDGTASIEVVWFNQPFLTKTIKQGSKISLSGKIGLFSHRPTLVNPAYDLLTSITQKSIPTQGLVPVYPETAGISSKWIRSKIREIIPVSVKKIEETLPEETLKRNKIIGRKDALLKIHFPKTIKQITQARKRLAFDELLITHLKTLKIKRDWKTKTKGKSLQTNQEKILALTANLPFTLTNSQKKVLKEILADTTSDTPMNRLLQGDVGSGKTVVAAIVAFNTYLNGYQSAFMAPTEILVQQHLYTLKSILSPLGVRVKMRTATHKKSEGFDVIVGTHALISKGVEFEKLAFIVIDEQHRFGVKQRGILRDKGITPHVLTMTATPIPRSLALTLYGDLELSNLDELPIGRKKVKTYVVPHQKRISAYQFIRDHIAKGRQTFILCPFIEPSETFTTVKAAKDEYLRLQKEVFPNLKLGLLHGKMKSKEKEEVLEKFRQGELNILVSTPIVEVGIDVPNASIMMIEAAERFGLASLHQLRGRVGRSAQQAYCLLFTESSSKKVSGRLSALEKYHLGSKLAEVDLKTRGPGEIYGTAQSGIAQFKMATLTDFGLIEATKKEAKLLLENLGSQKLKAIRSMMEKQGFIPPD